MDHEEAVVFLLNAIREILRDPSKEILDELVTARFDGHQKCPWSHQGVGKSVSSLVCFEEA